MFLFFYVVDIGNAPIFAKLYLSMHKIIGISHFTIYSGGGSPVQVRMLVLFVFALWQLSVNSCFYYFCQYSLLFEKNKFSNLKKKRYSELGCTSV